MSTDIFTALITALGTLAQVSAALAALIGFLGLWRSDWLRREEDQLDRDLRPLSGAIGIDAYTQRYPRERFIGKVTEQLRLIGPSESESFKAITDTLNQLESLQRERKVLTGALAIFLLTALGFLCASFFFLAKIAQYQGYERLLLRRVSVMNLILSIFTGYTVATAAGWLSRFHSACYLVITRLVGKAR
jgi:ABC-type cobalamin transport system permease subunit